MATKPKVGATDWKQDLARALEANETARDALRRLLRETGAGMQARGVIYAEIAQALADTLAALKDLQHIGNGSSNGTPKP